MIDQVFKLSFLSAHDCFLHLPYSCLKKLKCENSPPPIVKLSQDDKVFYLSLSPQPINGLSENSIGLSAIYANSLGLREGDVCVSSLGEQPPIKVVHACAVSEEDYDIIEISQTELELAILNQIRVVCKGQPITVWLSKNLHCNLVIDKLEPHMPIGKLMNLTEVVIGPTVSRQKVDNIIDREIVNAEKDEITGDSKSTKNKENLTFLSPSSTTMKKNKHSGIFRIVVIEAADECCDDLHNPLKNPYNVFVNKEIACWWQRQPVFERYASVCSLKQVSKPYEKTLLDSTSILYVRLYPIEECCRRLPTVKNGNNWRHQPLFVSSTVSTLLKLNNGSKVKLDLFSPSLDEKLSQVELIAPPGIDVDETETWFRNRLLATGNVLVNNQAPMPMMSIDQKLEYIMVILDPPTLTCWPFSPAEVQTCSLTVKHTQNQNSTDSDKANISGDVSPEQSLERVENVEILNPQNCRSLYKVITDGLAAIELALNLTDVPWMRDISHLEGSKNIIITGSGNNALADRLCDIISGQPHYVFISKIDCKTLRGKKVDTIEKHVLQALESCVYHQPSILLLNDIEAVVGKSVNHEQSAENNAWTQTVQLTCLMLKEIISDIGTYQSVSVLATAQNVKDISKDLIGSKRQGLFLTILEIPPFTQDDRIDILKEMIRNKLKIDLNKDIDLESFAERTENYVFEDLQQIVNKICFKAWLRKSRGNGKSELAVTNDDVLFALESVSPSHLKSIKLFKNSKHNWSSIGGMKQLKDLLTELIIWPAKFRKIYEQCPLKSENGVLLYGLPGTGKTLIASALAGECNLNFISVKGPELLSKYIGSSEENVRNIFERAQKAKPCILFFDEFDSLVPRRGHDNTGVTDRVVNQLLTQLDGVEERKGVWVLAASSRPDLIDPALLRPGRIGHNLHCNLPNQEERLEILEIIGKNLPLSATCDLRDVSRKTENFTGADLKSLLYSAHMIAYDELEINCNRGNSNSHSGESGYEIKQNVVGRMTIENNHILSALNDAKPSLKASEMLRYQKIYENFKASRTKKTRIQESIPEILQQRVTLA